MVSFSFGIQSEYDTSYGGAVQKYCYNRDFTYLSSLSITNLSVETKGMADTMKALYQSPDHINHHSSDGKHYYDFESGYRPRVTMEFNNPIKLSAICFNGILNSSVSGDYSAWVNDFKVKIFVYPLGESGTKVFEPSLVSIPAAEFIARYAVIEAPVTQKIIIEFISFCSYKLLGTNYGNANFGNVTEYAYEKNTADFVLQDLFPIFYENNPAIDEAKIKTLSTYNNIDVFSNSLPAGECKAKIKDGNIYATQLDGVPCSLWQDDKFFGVYYIVGATRDIGDLFDVRFVDIKGVLADLVPNKNTCVGLMAQNTVSQNVYPYYIDNLIYSAGYFNTVFLCGAHQYDRKTIIDNIDMLFQFSQIIQTAFLAEDSVGKMVSDLSFAQASYLDSKSCANLTFKNWNDTFAGEKYFLSDDIILGNPVYNESNKYDMISGKALRYMIPYRSGLVPIMPFVEVHTESVSLADESPIQVDSTGEIINVTYEGSLPSGYSVSFSAYSLKITYSGSASQSSKDFTISSLDPHYYNYSVYQSTSTKRSKNTFELDDKRASPILFGAANEPLIRMLMSSEGEIEVTIVDIEQDGNFIEMGMIMTLIIPQEGQKYGLVIGMERIFAPYQNTINLKLKEIPVSALRDYGVII